MNSILWRTFTFYFSRGQRLQKIKLYLLSTLSATAYAVLCYYLFDYFDAKLGRPFAISLIAYLFIAGETLVAIATADRFETITRPQPAPANFFQSIMDILLKKENRNIVMTIIGLFVIGFILPKLGKARN